MKIKHGRKTGLGLCAMASGFLVMGLVSSSGWAGTIAGTEHDFSASNTDGQLCINCHTPHNADTTVTAAPLWNHDITTATFTLYTSNSLDAVAGQPDGTSKLCLSCHDGTVAVDSFGGTTGTNFMTGNALLGTDLSDDHPISFTYDSALANVDGGLYDPGATNVTIGDPADRTKTGTITAVLLSGGKMECSSCHDVHNSFVPAGEPSLLKVTKTGSAICLTCHDK